MTDVTGGTAAPTEPVHRWVEPSQVEIDRNVDLYQITYDEASRTLDDQAAELSNARTRGVQYLAFVGSATAFLVGTTISTAHKHVAFYTLAGIATAFAVLAVAAVAQLLNPWAAPLFHRVEPRVLLEKWIEREVPAPSKAGMLRELALNFEDWRDDNEKQLVRIRKLYFCSIIFGAAQLAVWATLTWITG